MFVPPVATSCPLRRRGNPRFRKTHLFANRPLGKRRSRLPAKPRVMLLGPFGEPLTTPTGLAAELPFRFSTHYTDQETGLVYAKRRYYSPTMGRWLSRDPIEEDGGVNLYGFVENDSINRIDPFGLVDIVTPGVMPFGRPYRMHPDTSYLTDAGRQYFRRQFQQVGSGASLLDHLFTLGATSIADGFIAGGNIADQMIRGSERGDRRHRIISHSQGVTNAIFGVEDFARNYGSRLKRPTTVLIVGASPKLAPGIIDNKLRAASQLAPCLKISVLILYGTRDGVIPTFRLPPVGAWPVGNMQGVPNAEIGVPVSLRATLGHDWRATLGVKPGPGAYGMIPETEAEIAKEVTNEVRSYLRSGKLPQSRVILPRAIPVPNP